MARQTITLTEVARYDDNTVAYVTAVAADDLDFVNDGQTFLLIRNVTASPCIVKVVSVPDPATGRSGDIDRTLAAGEDMVVGPLPPHLFNQSNGRVNVDVDQAVQAAAIRFKKL